MKIEVTYFVEDPIKVEKKLKQRFGDKWESKKNMAGFFINFMFIGKQITKTFSVKIQSSDDKGIEVAFQQPIRLGYGSGPTIDTLVYKLMNDGEVYSILEEDSKPKAYPSNKPKWKLSTK
jgi:hypothetical protein